MNRTPQRLTALAMATGLALSACGGGSDDVADASKATVAESDTTVAPATTAEPVEETTTTEAPTTTEATTTTEAETTTTTAAAPAVAGPDDGVLFADDDGFYTLLISPEWSDGADAFPDGITGWFTGQESADFAENVNILTDSIPDITPIDGILDASISQIEAQFDGFNLIRSEVVTGVNHPELGLLEYSADQNGLEVRFVQVFGVWNGKLVVFTGSTDGRLGDEGADRLRPYALTLAPPS